MTRKSEAWIRDMIALKERELGVYPNSVTEFELMAAIRALKWVIGEANVP